MYGKFYITVGEYECTGRCGNLCGFAGKSPVFKVTCTQEVYGTLTEQVAQDAGNYLLTNMVGVVDMFLQAAGIIWLLRIVVLVVYSVISYVKLRNKLLCSIPKEENIYYADDIDTPFVLGVFRTKIYLPSSMKQENLSYVLEHERTHIRQADPMKKLVTYGVTMLHWFNPLAWVAFYFYGKDMEMACDEETVISLGVVQITDRGVSFDEMAIFKDGKFTEYQWHHNHSGCTKIENLEGCDMQALLCEVFVDNMTAADIMDYAVTHNMDIDEVCETVDLITEYWYVFFAETDADYAYVAFLNQDYFTKEDMIELAQSMKFYYK